MKMSDLGDQAPRLFDQHVWTPYSIYGSQPHETRSKLLQSNVLKITDLSVISFHELLTRT